MSRLPSLNKQFGIVHINYAKLQYLKFNLLNEFKTKIENILVGLKGA
jgi:hypothetical protein